ncbi:MAG: ATP-binding protein [Chloroflexi bacterium]|nr:ATP-binding protein [Chloroflexota bacterium]
MPEKIEETLKKLAENTSADGSTTENKSPPKSEMLGDPNCPYCKGVGYLREDHPVGHPNFGKLEICSCRSEAIRDRIRSRLYQFSNLDELEHLTFESFTPRGRMGLGEQQQDSIERARNQARTYAETLQGWLLIQGHFGVGKTHLAAAIGNECASRGISTLFLTVPDLLDSLRFTFSDKNTSFEQRFNEIRNTPLLILDDFGTQSATDWAREKLFQILNYRYINKLPLVVTTNLMLAEIEGRIRSRLSDPDVVAHIFIQAPDYRRPVDDSGQHELSSLALHSRQTFGTFNLRKRERLDPADQRTLEEAFKTAKKFAEDPEGWIVFTGTYGCGKTHIAAAIANYRASQGFTVIFVVVPDMLDHLRATFNPASSISYDRRFEEIRTAPLLILDDLGSQAMKPWVKEKLYQLFNYRYNATLPTIITSSDQFEEIDPRLRSRMRDQRLCQIKPITVPSYRGGKQRRKLGR